MNNYLVVLNEFKSVIGNKYVLTHKWLKQPFINGWRYGNGDAIAVLKPGNLLQLWKLIEICVSNDFIIIMQAANTGLTGGSTTYGNDYDRPVIIINTLRINDIHLINNANQIIAFSGSTLYDLETKLKPYNRDPHSVIGSTSIGATIVGGVCNNSGGSLVQRGPAYTELALYARVDENGKLEFEMKYFYYGFVMKFFFFFSDNPILSQFEICNSSNSLIKFNAQLYYLIVLKELERSRTLVPVSCMWST